MAQLNGKEFRTWKEYIEHKFPSINFTVRLEPANSTETYIVTCKEGKSATRIYLELFDDSTCRVTFDNPASPLSIKLGEEERQRAILYADYTLEDTQLLATDSYIHIPLYCGWNEKLTYYTNKLLREEMLYYKAGKFEHLHTNTYYWNWYKKAGCLLFPIVLPALWIESRIVKRKISQGKNIKIQSTEVLPMLNTYNSR